MSNGLLARYTLGFIFIYHGLVPKILFISQTELAMNRAHDFFGISPERIALMGGVAEIVLGVLIVLYRRAIWPVGLAMLGLLLLLLDVALMLPQLLVEAFNPVTINIAGLVLGWIAWREHISSQEKII
ncbi:MAG: DoxX-like family protein [Moraxellaceae bacterium]